MTDARREGVVAKVEIPCPSGHWPCEDLGRGLGWCPSCQRRFWLYGRHAGRWVRQAQEGSAYIRAGLVAAEGKVGRLLQRAVTAEDALAILKAEKAAAEGERDLYKAQARHPIVPKLSVDCISQGCKRAQYDAAAIKADDELEANLQRVRAALEAVLALIDEGWLVRNTANDGHFPSYMKESVRLVKALAEAQAALTGPATGGK